MNFIGFFVFMKICTLNLVKIFIKSWVRLFFLIMDEV